MNAKEFVACWKREKARYKSKIQTKDHFLTGLMSEKKIFIAGTQDELKAIIRAK